MPYDRYTDEQREMVAELLGANKNPRPARSELTFKEIADRVGVSQAFVSNLATLKYEILPPRIGRPPGPGKKLGQRSPHRRRAAELRAAGLSLRAIAARITEEERAKAKTKALKQFKISAEAVRQLLDTDEEFGKSEK